MNGLNEKQRAYLEELSSIETPSQRPGQSQEDRDKEVCRYIDIKNAAREILQNPAEFETSKGKLADLLQQVGLEYKLLTK